MQTFHLQLDKSMLCGSCCYVRAGEVRPAAARDNWVAIHHNLEAGSDGYGGVFLRQPKFGPTPGRTTAHLDEVQAAAVVSAIREAENWLNNNQPT